VTRIARALWGLFRQAFVNLLARAATPKELAAAHQEARRMRRRAKADRPLAKKIAQATRNSVAVGFRKYHRLAA
jgi:hypothetical protein